MSRHPINRRNLLAMIGAGSATLGLSACTGRMVADATTPSAAAVLDRVAWNLLETDPELATSLGVDTGLHTDLRSRMRDRSPDGLKNVAQVLRADLLRIEAIATELLDPATRTSLAVVKNAYRTALDGFALPYGDVAVGGWRNTPYVVIQNVGAYLDIQRFLDADHPVRIADDAEAYLARLTAMPALLDGELARIRSAAEFGLIPPDFLLDRTLRQLTQSLANARSGGDLVQSLVGRTGAISGNWEGRARSIVTKDIAAALERQISELVRQRQKATSDTGMADRPGGDEFYAWALRASTTTRLSPGEIHDRGLHELSALHARMDPILRSLGYTIGSVGERMSGLSRDPRFMFPEGDAGRTEILATIQQRIKWVRAQMPRAFTRLVSGQVEIRRLPLIEELGAPNAYGGPGSIDGSIPGKMWINLRTTELHRRYDLPTLVHHESIPGHVWQGEYANRLPLIRSILSFNAYSEGWALYAEQLADELGAYKSDPVGQLGYLQSLAFRACRMVVDTGLHAKRWTRGQAIDFFVTRNGSKRDEIEGEVDRYCSWPGQACGYKMGHSEIIRQRQEAQKALGSRFDLREFDQAVVDGGNVPLNVLADNVRRYIAARTT